MEIDGEPQIQAVKVVLNYLVGIFKTKSKKKQKNEVCYVIQYI